MNGFLRHYCLVITFVVAAAATTDHTSARAESLSLTLEDARMLTRQQAPAVLAARARIDAARGERAGASIWLQSNPEIEAGAGPRRVGSEETTDLELGISHSFELGNRRGARIARADAGVDRTQSTADDVVRRLIQDVSGVFVQTLHAEELLRVARENESLTRELRRVATRRHEVGDVGILDVDVATFAYAHAQAEVSRLEARRIGAVGELGALLGLDPSADISVVGDLADRDRFQLDSLLARAVDRPDLLALTAEIREAQAIERLGKGYAWPDLDVFALYKEEEDAEVLMGGLALSIPLFDHGQELKAVGAAQQRALSFELEGARRAVSAQVRAAFAAYSVLDDAALQYEREAGPRVEASLDLARRSYESGNIALGEMLVLQREIIDSRNAYADLLLDAAMAAIALEAAAGVLK